MSDRTTEQVLRDLRDQVRVWLNPQELGPKWWWGPWKAWRKGWHQGESEAAGWIMDAINRELTRLQKEDRDEP